MFLVRDALLTILLNPIDLNPHWLGNADSSDMSVVENFVVSGRDWTVMDTGRGDDHLVRRILMERLWQASRLDHDCRGSVKQLHAGVTEGNSEPHSYIVRKLQPPIFKQLGDHPSTR
jgi:hypothetical protein